MLWLFMAILSALFAGLTAILAKCGIKKTDSDIATALRTAVVLVFSWIMVFVTGSLNQISSITTKSLVFLVLSGLSTGASWICYFKALSIGDVNKVAPIDKLSTALTVIIAIILFGETKNIASKLVGTALVTIGILLMIEKRDTNSKSKGPWFIYAVLSALFASLTSILAKIGLDGIDSNLATAIRTVVVLAMAWLIVFIKKKQPMLHHINKRELAFIGLSGIATGCSWLCYYYAIQNGVVSVVVPIDKMSLLVTVVFSYFIFKEKLSKKALCGLVLMLLGTVLIAMTH